MSTPAIFIDRDGTLCEEVGYLNDLSRLRIFPWAVDAVRLINKASRRAVLVTNQAGVARGYFPESLVEEVHDFLREHLASGGAKLDGIYYCPHHPGAGKPPYRQDCLCRKPKPGLIKQAEVELGIDLEKSWVIGDRYSDVELATTVGAKAAMVKTGYGRGELRFHSSKWARQPDLVAENLLEAVERILGA
jgi:D-glycero-D-manno-heptose 1,7-bisphosphate phosphatase